MNYMKNRQELLDTLYANYDRIDMNRYFGSKEGGSIYANMSIPARDILSGESEFETACVCGFLMTLHPEKAEMAINRAEDSVYLDYHDIMSEFMSEILGISKEMSKKLISFTLEKDDALEVIESLVREEKDEQAH